jgi:hypothetical protein
MKYKFYQLDSSINIGSGFYGLFVWFIVIDYDYCFYFIIDGNLVLSN